jgi:Na+-driven multidrug efflux pump
MMVVFLRDQLDETIKVSLEWSTLFCAVVALVMIFIPQPIISLFTKNDAMLIDIGVRALRANGIVFILFGFEQVYMSLFLAMGKGKEGGLLSISRQGLFFIPAILMIPRLFGIAGVIWAQPVADVNRCIHSKVTPDIFFCQYLNGIAEKIFLMRQ